MRKLLIAFLFVAIIDISISSEVQNSSDKRLINVDVLNKKLLPDVKHLMKDSIDGNRQKFLHLLNDLEVDGYKFVNDAPFTIIIPKISFDTQTIGKSKLRRFIFEHILPGVQMKALRNGEVYGNMNRNAVEVKSLTPNKWTINGTNVLNFNSLTAKLISFVEIDGYLTEKNVAKRNIQEYHGANEPQKLVQKDMSKSEATAKENKVGLLQSYLSTMKSGTKVFHQFLTNSNLSHVLEDTSNNYIILVPSDTAFQRWHPIDWGFYPFSVPEFTESIMRNHVIPQKQPFNLRNIEKEQKMKTLDGEYVVFSNSHDSAPMVNNVSIISNATLANGNDVFIISEVLFMTDAKVTKLLQDNKDKETPPLLAFPWFGSQFLSHAYIALESENRFTQITRFLQKDNIVSSSIIGSNYTFFVPFDDAFEKYGFDQLPDSTISSEKFVNMMLNHFVKGRLYNRDLIEGQTYEAVGGKKIHVKRDSLGHIFVNGARIVESEVFVYNLGTMYYIDDIFYPETLGKEYKVITQPTRNRENIDESSEEFYTTETPIYIENEEKMTTKSNRESTTPEHHSILQALLTTRSDVEFVPSQFSEFADVEDFSNSETLITPKALPSRYVAHPPKK